MHLDHVVDLAQDLTDPVHVPITAVLDLVQDLDHIILGVDLVLGAIQEIEDVWIAEVVSVVDMVIEALIISQDSSHTKVVEVIMTSYS